MTNVEFRVKDNLLTISVDLKQDHGKSKSGKTSVVATTHGFAHFEDEGEQIMFSLNVNKK